MKIHHSRLIFVHSLGRFRIECPNSSACICRFCHYQQWLCMCHHFHNIRYTHPYRIVFPNSPDGNHILGCPNGWCIDRVHYRNLRNGYFHIESLWNPLCIGISQFQNYLSRKYLDFRTAIHHNAHNVVQWNQSCMYTLPCQTSQCKCHYSKELYSL